MTRIVEHKQGGHQQQSGTGAPYGADDNAPPQQSPQSARDPTYLRNKDSYDVINNNIGTVHRMGQAINDKAFHKNFKRNAGYNVINNTLLPA